MVLDDKGAVKPKRLRLDIVFDKVTIPLAAVEFRGAAPRRRAAEQTELHRVDVRPAVSGRASRKARSSVNVSESAIGIAFSFSVTPGS